MGVWSAYQVTLCHLRSNGDNRWDASKLNLTVGWHVTRFSNHYDSTRYVHLSPVSSASYILAEALIPYKVCSTLEIDLFMATWAAKACSKRQTSSNLIVFLGHTACGSTLLNAITHYRAYVRERKYKFQNSHVKTSYRTSQFFMIRSSSILRKNWPAHI